MNCKLSWILLLSSTVLFVCIFAEAYGDNQQSHHHYQSHHPKSRHDNHHASHKLRKITKNSLISKHLHNKVHFRDGDQHCRLVCSNETTTNNSTNSNNTNTNIVNTQRSLKYDTNSSLIILYDNAANLAIAIDYNSTLIATINGNSGIIIIVDASNKTITRLSENGEDALKDNFRDYLSKICLEKLAQEGKNIGHSSNVSDITQEDLKEINDILNRLGIHLIDDKNGLQILISAVKCLHDNKDRLRFILNGNGEINTSLSFSTLIGILEGINYLNSLSPDARLHLDLSAILTTRSGAEAFLNIIQQLNNQTEFGRKILGNIFSSPENLLSTLVKFTGNSSNPIDDEFRIIHSIITLINGQGSVDSLILASLNYAADGGFSQSPSEFIRIARVFLSIAKTLNFPGASNIAKFFDDIINNNLMINSINISNITSSFIRDGRQNGLRAFVGLLFQLRQYLGPFTAIPDLFFRLSGLLTHPHGIDILNNFIPGFNFTEQVGNGNPLQNILNSSNLVEALNNGTQWNSTFIRSIPGIGDIFHNIAEATGGFNNYFASLFNSSNVFGGGLQHFLQSFLHDNAIRGGPLFPQILPTISIANITNFLEQNGSIPNLDGEINGNWIGKFNNALNGSLGFAFNRGLSPENRRLNVPAHKHYKRFKKEHTGHEYRRNGT